MTLEQVTGSIQELQRMIGELQHGSIINVQAMANMQATVAGLQNVIQAGEAPRPGGGGGQRLINHQAAKGLSPASWAGDEDPIPFQEFSAEMINYACALNDYSKDIMDQAAKHTGQLDIVVDIECEEEGLPEVLNGEVYRQFYKASPPEVKHAEWSTTQDREMGCRLC